MTEETVPPVTDKDDEYPQTVKTGEIEPRPAKEPVEEVQESQVWAVEAPDSELLHDEREVEVPAAAPSAAEQEVEAETQLSNQAETVAPVEELQKVNTLSHSLSIKLTIASVSHRRHLIDASSRSRASRLAFLGAIILCQPARQPFARASITAC
jgi:hypothetical protein